MTQRHVGEKGGYDRPFSCVLVLRMRVETVGRVALAGPIS